MCAHANIASGKISAAISHTKTNHSILNFACGKKVTGYRKWRLVNVILLVRGLFDGEYLVASKQAGPFDFTLGMAWGYAGNAGNITNPFCRVSDKYCHRAESHDAGDISFSDIFRGPASIFGGIEYQTPWNPLRLKLEYDGNNYQNDFAGKLPQASHFNVGAVYRAASWADLNLSYERGNTLMFASRYGPISTICALPCAIRQNRHINLRLNLKDCSTPQ